MKIEDIFTYQRPEPDQIVKYAQLRLKAKELALMISDFCPDSREKDIAIDHLRTCIMWSNTSIALNECKTDLHGEKT